MAKQYGDIVYFAQKSSDEHEHEKIWVIATPLLPACKWVSEHELENPAFSLFQLLPPQPNASLGDPVLPGAALHFLHVQSGCYLAFVQKPLVLSIKLDAVEKRELRLAVVTGRSHIEAGVRDADEVTVFTKSDESEYHLGSDFCFKGFSSDTFVVHVYESHQESLEPSTLRFGQTLRLRADNGMFLSVLPNSTHNFKLVLTDEEMKEDYTQAGPFLYPEYQGPLRADLTNDEEDANGYWVVERRNALLGGRVKSSEEFCLRHIASHKYLGADLTLGEKAQLGTFLVAQQEGFVELGKLVCVTTAADAAVSLDLTPRLGTIKTQIFEPVLSQLSPSAVLRLPLTTKPSHAQFQSLHFSAIAVPAKSAGILQELSLYLPLVSEMRLALQHLKRQPNIPAVLYGISNRVLLKTLIVMNESHTFLAHAASDFQIVNELLRIWTLKQRMFKDYENLFTDVNFFVHLTNPMQNLQFYERVSRNLFSNHQLLIESANATPVGFTDIVVWAVKSRPPRDFHRLFWASALLPRAVKMATYNEVTSLAFFCHFLLERLQKQVQVKDSSFLAANGDFVFKFRKADEGYIGVAYGSEAPVLSLFSDKLGFSATVLELYADVCTHTTLKSEIVQGTGLTLDVCYGVFQVSREFMRVNMAMLYFIADVHVPGSCETPPLVSITSTKLLSRASLSGVLETAEASEWFYFPAADSPLCALLREEVEFWYALTHVPMTCDEQTTWYYNTVVHFRFAAQLIEHCPVSDMFVVSVVSAAIALTLTALDIETPGFSERFPKLKESKYRTETEKQRTVEELLELLAVYQRWRLVKVIRKSFHGGVMDRLDTKHIEAYLQELDFLSIFNTFCSANGVDPTAPSPDPHSLSTMAHNLLQVLKATSVKAALTYFSEKTKYSRRGIASGLEDMLAEETNGAQVILQHISEIAAVEPYAAFLPMVTAVQLAVLSVKEIATVPSEGVERLVEYLSALESIVDFMLGLDAENLARFQAFLSKADFITELERAWNYCIWQPASAAKDAGYVLMRTLTIEASRLYAHNNPSHRAQVLRILPMAGFYPQYPQYLSLIKALGLLDSFGNVASGIAKVVLDEAIESPNKAFGLTLSAMLAEPKLQSSTFFTIVDFFKRLQAERLSDSGWELLILAGLAVPQSERKVWLSEYVQKWYNTTPEAIRREGAAAVVFADDRRSPYFRNALSNTVAHLTQINTRSVEQIELNFEPLVHIPKAIRRRNYEKMESDIRYLLELYFAPSEGFIYQFLRWQDAENMPALVGEFASLYAKMKGAQSVQEYMDPLYRELVKYLDELGNTVPGEVSEAIDQLRDTPVVYQPPDLRRPGVPEATLAFRMRE